MNGTVTGLDLDRLEALVAAHDDNPPETLGGECDGCHVEDVRSALAAARAVKRVEAMLTELRRRENESAWAQGESPRPSDYSEGHYNGHRKGMLTAVNAIAAALGTEQEGRTE